MEGKNSSVFVDSNFLIALFHEKDSLFSRADRISKELVKQNRFLCISSFVFLETITIVSMRAGRKIAVEAGKYLLSNSRIQIIHIDENLQEESWHIFQEIQSKNISFVDCSIIAAMKPEGISTLLTFDATDFKRLQKPYGFKLYGE
jgi:predicted nucleic acid-binding protein